MKQDIKQIEEVKDKIIGSSSKGFKYFFKNALLVILIFLGCWIFTNPEIIMNPSEFFSNLDRSSIYSIAILFLIVFGVFQISKSILKENRELLSEEESQRAANVRRKHNEDAFKRMKNNPQISMVLKDILINLNASRSTVCEIHNGTNTLAGVPFIHLTMTFEEISNEVQYSREDYIGLNMSRIPFIAKHWENGVWVGTTDNIEKEDKFLATKLKSNNDNYMGFILVHGKEEPLAVLTVAFTDKDEHPTKDAITKELIKASQKIGNLLDK